MCLLWNHRLHHFLLTVLPVQFVYFSGILPNSSRTTKALLCNLVCTSQSHADLSIPFISLPFCFHLSNMKLHTSAVSTAAKLRELISPCEALLERLVGTSQSGRTFSPRTFPVNGLNLFFWSLKVFTLRSSNTEKSISDYMHSVRVAEHMRAPCRTQPLTFLSGRSSCSCGLCVRKAVEQWNKCAFQSYTPIWSALTP